MVVRTATLALALLLAFVGAAAALGQQPAPDPAQQQPAPDATQPSPPTTPQETDEDDEELGEDIPGDDGDEEGDDEGSNPPADPGSGTGGTGDDTPRPASPEPRAEARQDRLPRTGGDPIALLVAGLASLGLGLLVWAAIGPRPSHP